MGVPDYTALNWGLTAAAGVLTVGRYSIRWFNSRRLWWDDLVHLFAFFVLVAHGVTNQLTLHSKQNLTAALIAKPKTPAPQLLHLYQRNHDLGTVNNCFLYLVFWIVKVSFLLFYRLLFQTSSTFKKVWWGVLVFTLVTVWIPLGGVLSTCTGADTVEEYKICSGQSQARITRLAYSCAFNVFTDLLIMALPLWMIHSLKVTTPQRLGLTFVFSFAIVCVILDIVRVIEAARQNQDLYTIIEINFVVIISCLPTYRTLLTMHQARTSRKSSRPTYGVSGGEYASRSKASGGMMGGGGQWRSLSHSGKAGTPMGEEDSYALWSREAASPREREVYEGKDGIHVTRDISVVSADYFGARDVVDRGDEGQGRRDDVV